MRYERAQFAIKVVAGIIVTLCFSLFPASHVTHDFTSTLSCGLLRTIAVQPVAASAPSDVEFLLAREVTSGVELTWMVVSENDVEGFKLYRRESDQPIYILLNNDGLIHSYLYEFVDGSAEGGTAYQYVLGVVYTDGSEQLSMPAEIATSE